jgi:hypothetical protein
MSVVNILKTGHVRLLAIGKSHEVRVHYPRAQNITFNADKSDIELAREEARSQNTTLHELFRDWLKRSRD